MNMVKTDEPAKKRYHSMQYRNAGRSDLKLPLLSRGSWQNFGFETSHGSLPTETHVLSIGD